MKVCSRVFCSSQNAKLQLHILVSMLTTTGAYVAYLQSASGLWSYGRVGSNSWVLTAIGSNGGNDMVQYI
jgi:hypothetical protein